MKQLLLKFFRRFAGSAFKPTQIAEKLNITTDHEYAKLKAMVFQLHEEGIIMKVGKRFKMSTEGFSGDTIIGTLEVTSGGFGFVIPKNKGMDDIFIAERNLGGAFDGDVVEVSLFAKQKGGSKNKRMEGQIVKVLKPAFTEISGTLESNNGLFFVVPDNARIHKDIYIPSQFTAKAKIGDKVLVGDIQWTDTSRNPEGKIKETFGAHLSLDAEVTLIAKEYRLPYQFSEAVLKEAEAIPEEIDKKALKGRVDMRKKVVVTIDPDDAKDFDDALSIEELEDGNYEVGIHIADVSHYVQYGSSLDKEAEKRGNSVYLVGRVIPMLPEKLSNNVCSLVPHKDRLTFSVFAVLTPRGKVVSWKVSKSVINSKRRFTYEEAQKIIEGEAGDFQKEILLLHKLATVLRNKRMRERSINFETAEVKFRLDEVGFPIEVFIKIMKESNNLVEEFMLLANQIVAMEYTGSKKRGHKPMVFRVHDKPDPSKLNEFLRFVKSLGYQVEQGKKFDAPDLNRLLSQIKGKPESSVVNELAIRSMAKAVYSHQNIGHFGLGYDFYSHFTSPIRRYADLLAHRLIQEHLLGKKPYLLEKQVEDVCKHISETERSAVEAERASIKIKQIQYLKKMLGFDFDAVISGVTNFGIFIKIEKVMAEGLIRLKDMDQDHFIFDERNYCIVGRRTKKVFRLGDRVEVKLIKINEERNELDFILL